MVLCRSFFTPFLALGLLLNGVVAGRCEDRLSWSVASNQVSADIRSTELLNVLEGIAGKTGWKVFVEPQTLHVVSAKFKNLPPGPALRLLLGDVNFALVPATNSSGDSKLYVFRTTMQRATQRVNPALAARKRNAPKVIPNELVIGLKRGAKIEDIAKLLGAKVIGRIGNLNAYRLQFDDQAAADSAKASLASNSDVTSVDNNYSIDRPAVPTQAAGANAGPPMLQLKDPPPGGQIIVGLVDTAVQPLGNGLDAFLLKQLSASSSGAADLDPNSPSHGTAMAETMLRALETETGGKTSVQIQPVDVFGANASTTTFDVANGIVTAYNSGANPINLSLGSGADAQILSDLINQLEQKGIVFVGAKGNTPDSNPFYPAAYPGVVAVTALDDNGKVASYANLAAIPSVGAPGTSLVIYNGMAWTVTGTSPAAADVTGLIAGTMDKNHVNAGTAKTAVMGALPKE
jgi:hypothetical protein